MPTRQPIAIQWPPTQQSFGPTRFTLGYQRTIEPERRFALYRADTQKNGGHTFASRGNTQPRVTRIYFIVVLAIGLALHTNDARAEREHRVRQGQNLARIAKHYGVSALDIEAANHLRPGENLSPGQLLVIPDAAIIFVRQGQTLRTIARLHHVTEADLAHANHLETHASLRKGQRLVLPGSSEAAETGSRWGRPRHPGTGTFYRIATSEMRKIKILDRRGQVRKKAIHELARMMAPRNAPRNLRDPHPQLVRLVARVSDHFGGRTIDIISGYRPPGGYTQRESRHTQGHAIDFRIRGVPNTTLRDFCKTFEHVGVGYYPNSYFVHLDVRRDSAYWVDLSAPGEAPHYARAGEEAREGSRAAHSDAPLEGDSDIPSAADDNAPPIDEAPNALSNE